MGKNKIIIYVVAGCLMLFGLYQFINPILEKLNLKDDKDERREEKNNEANNNKAKEQQSKLPPTNVPRKYNDFQLKDNVVTLNEGLEGWFYDYTQPLRSIRHWYAFSKSDCRRYLEIFVQTHDKTLYQWYLKKFANESNARSQSDYKKLFETYKKEYSAMGIEYGGNFSSIDKPFQLAMEFIYKRAEIAKN